MTGTDGKTTTAEMIAHILRSSGKRVLSITTVGISSGDQLSIESKRTTPSPWRLQRILRQAVENGIHFAVVEVSSHAISQRRIFGISFDIAVLTNITPEHLDYHHNFSAYADTKKELLFNFLKYDGVAILNHDDALGKKWYEELKLRKTKAHAYSLDPRSRVFRIAQGIKQKESGLEFDLLDAHGQRLETILLPVLGVFNVENALAAITATSLCGISMQRIAGALINFPGVAGRMERVHTNADYAIFVDFAITPGALEKTLLSAKKLAGNKRVIVVFGSPGNHPDPAARRNIGSLAVKHADTIIITDDETYLENPDRIRHHILAGANKTLAECTGLGKHVHEIPDRKKAIEMAIQLAGAGDVLLVCGMGHLKTRNIGGKEFPWNDVAMIREILKHNASQSPLLS